MDIEHQVRGILAWICPGRRPQVEIAKPRHPLVDEVVNEVRISFTDDDMDEIIFREMLTAYTGYHASRSECSRDRIVFALMNRRITAHAMTICGRLESTEMEIEGDVEPDGIVRTSPALSIDINLGNPNPQIRSTRHIKEYYIEGRRHRSDGLPAVEIYTHHNDVQDHTSLLESEVDIQYWEHGEPRFGVRPYRISYGSSLVMLRAAAGVYLEKRKPNAFQTTIRDMDVRWIPTLNAEEVATHPLRMTFKKSRTEFQVTNDVPAYGGFISHDDIIIERTIDGIVLEWPLGDSLVAQVEGDELFRDIGVQPAHIDWVGGRFFTRDLEELEFLTHMTSRYDEWKTSQKR